MKNLSVRNVHELEVHAHNLRHDVEEAVTLALNHCKEEKDRKLVRAIQKGFEFNLWRLITECKKQENVDVMSLLRDLKGNEEDAVRKIRELAPDLHKATPNL